MKLTADKMAEFVTLLNQFTPQEGPNKTSLAGLFTFRGSAPAQRQPVVYDPFIILGGQGRKYCYLDGRRYDYSAGNFLAMFLPMPLETELIEASADRPFLAAYIEIDLNRLANLALKIDRVESVGEKPGAINSSGIFSAPLHDHLLEPAIRLLKSLGLPRDAAILGESIVEEIYYRILCNEQGGSLKYLLQQRGQIQRISKAVEYIHQNLDEMISVEKLAELVNMSYSGFHKSFKDVMHLSPLQYTKSVKLFKARMLIKTGKNVSEAAYQVGYNSLAQFSREYKRHFGFAPSET